MTKLHELRMLRTIPIVYDEDALAGILENVNIYIDKTIKFGIKGNDITLGNEVIYSSIIEGYKTKYKAEDIGNIESAESLSDKAAVNLYEAYKMIDTEIENKENLVEVWRKIVKYHNYTRNNIRILPVVVGNKYGITHRAPSFIYLKTLLNDLFDTIHKENDIANDKYNLIKAILAHYVLAYIHPFIDGNGRISRLYEQYIINKYTGIGIIPISEYIYNNRSNYYFCYTLAKVYDRRRLKQLDITDFIKLNLQAIIDGLESLTGIESLIRKNGEGKMINFKYIS